MCIPSLDQGMVKALPHRGPEAGAGRVRGMVKSRSAQSIAVIFWARPIGREAMLLT
ncbi:hypothetical protein GCM10009525_35920 [Streptosporangium amethystogenes subsp. fukuiense]